MNKTFDANRIGEALVTRDGRNQFLITGKINDYFFANAITGVCTDIEQALNSFGLIRRYDMVMMVDMNDIEQPLRFSPPEMKAKYDAIVSGITPTPRDGEFVSEDDVDETASDIIDNSDTNTDAAAAQVVSASVKSLTLEFDRILKRLIPSKYKSLVIVRNAEKILQYTPDGSLTAESQRQLEAVRNWAKLKNRGHADTATVLIIEQVYFDEFEGWSHNYIGGLAEQTKKICIGEPDRHEIEAMLVRLQCRYGLLGNPATVAQNVHSQLQKNGDGMLNIVANVIKKMNDTPKPTLLEELFDDELANRRRKALAEAENELANIIGLAAVKERVKHLRNLAARLQRQREAGDTPANTTLHSLLVGNPGTGKTVIARILGKLYFGLGIRQSDTFVEITAADVSSAYNPGDASEKLLTKLKEATGGVLFIDEIYQFGEDQWLKQAFQNVLMAYMENNRDSITVIGAGYEEKIPDILGINPGVTTRFNHPDNTIVFPDYTEGELLQIAQKMLEKEKRTLTPEAHAKMLDYITSREQLGGIGNGRGVRNMVDKIISNADELQQFREVEEDAVPRPITPDFPKARQILGEMNEKLKGLVGLKKHLETLLVTQEDKILRKRFCHSTQHLALLGNPGTGKTTAVPYVARFFHTIGITSRDKIILCDVARDFADTNQVRRKFDEALGGVLFIDEAYRLVETHAGQQVIHQIVQLMTEKNYRDLVVIIAGYTDKMQNVFRSNSGLADRFKKHILFENFTITELEQIFQNTLIRDGFRVSDDELFQQTLVREFKRLQNDPHFANARSVEKYYQEVSARRAVRCHNTPDDDRFAIATDDLKSSIERRETVGDILAELDVNFIGLQSVKNQIRKFAKLVEYDIRMGQTTEKQGLNLQFLGNPGTGKTTIARYMARLYNAIGLIDGIDIIEKSAVSLKGSYLGQSKDQVILLY